jgi:hypothetical protein
MANVKKNSKIDFYKLTGLPKVSTGSKTKEGKRQAELQQAARLQTVALNGLGKTLNSIGKSLIEFRELQFQIYKRVDRQSKQDFTAVFNMPTAPRKQGNTAARTQEKIEPPSWLESVFEVLKLALAGLVGGALFKFLSNEENRKKTKKALEMLFDVIGAITNFFGGVAYNAIDGLWQLLCNEDASWLDRFGGFLKAFVSIGTGLLAIKWLKNPMSLLKDFKKGFKAFRSGLKTVGKKLGKRLMKIGLAGLAVTSLVTLFSGDNDPDQEMAKGGKTKKRARGGGFINGPMSGYPVSLDGGKSTAFIGHGLEYVAQKSSGGFVVPINTPATQNNSGLMGQRMVEASRMGYDLGGMTRGFDGGGEYSKDGKAKGQASSRAKREERRFSKLFMAAGGELGKLGDGTKLVNAPSGYCTTGVLNTAQANGAKVGAPHVATGRDPNNPRGLLAQAVKDFGYASLNIGQPKQINSPYGRVGVKEMNFGQWKKAVKGNKVPSGSLIFSTRHNDWNNARSSSGNDSAIAKNGGRKLWSGHWQAVVDGVGAVYGAGTKKVVALVHPKGHQGGFTGEVAPGGGESSPLALSGTAKQLIGGDTEFLEKVKKLSAKYQINPADLLGKFASESGLDPAADNGTHVGLIQFSKDSAAAVGTTQAALKRMSRAEQMDYVEKYFDYWKLPKGASAGHLYTISYLPAFAKESADYVLAKRGGFSDKNGNHPASWYDHNAGLDQNGDGMITIGELGERIQKKKREFGITGGEVGPYTGSPDNIAGDDSGSAIDGVASAATQLMNPMEAFTQLASKLLGDKAPPNPFADTSAGGSLGSDEKPKPGSSAAAADMKGAPEASAIGDSGHTSKSGGQASSAQGGSENLQNAAAKGTASNLSGGGTSGAAPAGATNVGGPSASTGSIMTAQTQATMNARSEKKKSNREAIATALQITEVQNAEVAQVRAQASEASKQAAAMAQPQQQYVPTGGGEAKQSLVARLNSTNNLLKRFES